MIRTSDTAVADQLPSDSCSRIKIMILHCMYTYLLVLLQLLVLLECANEDIHRLEFVRITRKHNIAELLKSLLESTTYNKTA